MGDLALFKSRADGIERRPTLISRELAFIDRTCLTEPADRLVTIKFGMSLILGYAALSCL